VEARYAIVTVAILLPDWVEDEADVREWLRLSFKAAGVEAVSAEDLPEDGEPCH